ncbi:hypothetical protein KJ359_007879 [Pestalotiopsis sp. 9143b]|nr:hypothetical protein KJ359_007879 [Pestalotiopsis sp. 9143b]
MTSSHGEDSAWAIESIPVDDAGFAFYLSEYKPFRLTALRQDPDAFGSTYEREAASGDEYWHRRLYNPLARTFVAVRLRDRRVLSATTVYGPMPHNEVVPNPGIAADAAISTTATANDTQGDPDDHVPLVYQLTGVYTRAEFRGRGLGKALSRAAAEYAHADALRRGARCRLGLDVYAANTAAVAFYQKCGFAVGGPRPVDEDSDEARPELVMYYRSADGDSGTRRDSRSNTAV